MHDERAPASRGGRYAIRQLAVGSYDLLLDGRIVGSVVRNVSSDGRLRDWRAELLDDAGEGQRPLPFTADEHVFTGLDAVLTWLGVPRDTTLA